MTNFDVAIKATETAMKSSGSAMRENEVYAKSLEGKMNNLKSSFSEFANNILSSGLIGGLLTVGSGLLTLTTASGMAIPAITGLGVAILGAVVPATSAMGLFLATFGLPILAVVGAIALVVKAFDIFHVTLNEQNKIVETLSESIVKLQGEYDTLNGKTNKTDVDEKRLAILKQQLDIQELQLTKEKELQASKEYNANQKDAKKGLSFAESSIVGYDSATSRGHVANTSNLNKAYTELLDVQDRLVVSKDSLTIAQQAVVAQQIEDNDIVLKQIANRLGLNDAIDANSNAFKKQSEALTEAEIAWAGISLENDKAIESANKNIDAISSLTDTIYGMNDANNLSRDEIQQLLKDYPELRKDLVKTETGYNINKEAIIRVRDAMVNQGNTSLSTQKQITLNQVANVTARIKLYNSEIGSIKNLAEAQKALAGMFSADYNNKNLPSKESTDSPLFRTDVQKNTTRDLKILTSAYEDLQAIEISLIDTDFAVTGSLGDVQKATKSVGKATKDANKTIKDTTKTIEDYKNKIRDLGTELEKLNISLTNVEDSLKLINAGDYNTPTDLTMSLEQINVAYTQHLDTIYELYAEYDRLKDLSNGELTDAMSLLSDKIKGESKEIKNLDKQLEIFQKNEVERRKKVWEDNKKAMLDYIKEQQDLLKVYEADLNELTTLEAKRIKQELNDKKDSYSEKKKLAQTAYDEEVDRLDDLTDKRKKATEDELDALEKANKAEIKVIDDKLKKYKDLLDARKKAISDASDTRGYEQQLGKLNAELSNMETQSASLKNDETAKAKYLELQQSISDKKLEIENLQYARGVELQTDAIDTELKKYEEAIEVQKDASDDKYKQDKNRLDDQLDDYDDYLKSQKDSLKVTLDAQLATYDGYIKTIEQQLSEEGTLRQQALDNLKNNTQATYQALLQYNSTYGTGVSADIDKLWASATSAVQRYGASAMNVLSLINSMQSETKQLDTDYKTNNDVKWEDESKGVLNGTTSLDSKVPNKFTPQEKSRIDKMKENSAQWTGASASRRKELELYNLQLGTSMGANRDDASGVWYLNGKKMYHSGGVVGGETKLKSNEEFAKLLNGEVVSTQAQMDNFMRKTLPTMLNSSPMTTNNSSDNGISLVLNIAGNADDNTVRQLESKITKIADTVFGMVTKTMGQKGNNRNAKTMSI